MSTKKQMAVLDLDELVKPVGKVKAFGQEHDVLPISGRGYQILRSISESGKEGDSVTPEYVDMSRRIVKDILPTLTEDQIERLNIEQLVKIIALAGDKLEKVTAIFADASGNGQSPPLKARRAAAG